MNRWVFGKSGRGYGLSLWGCIAFSLAVFPMTVSFGDTPLPSRYNINRATQEFSGPGRDRPEPVDFSDVPIGYFGPMPEEDIRYAGLYYGILAAIEEANEGGGYRDKPFRLVSRWATDPWGAGSREVIHLAYRDNVWAVIGSIDGETSHVAIQILTIARLSLVSPTATVPGLTQAGVPWMFRIAPNDPSQTATLAAHMSRSGQRRKLALITSTAHDARVFRGEMIKALSDAPVSICIETQIGSEVEAATATRRILRAEPDAVCMALDFGEAVSVLGVLHESGWKGDTYGWGLLSARAFVDLAGNLCERMVVPRLWDTQLNPAESERFTVLYRDRFGEEPDADAAYGYDAARLVIQAVRMEGLNRVRIRDGLSSAAPFQGVTGPIIWDGGGGNTRPARLWQWGEDGKLKAVYD